MGRRTRRRDGTLVEPPPRPVAEPRDGQAPPAPAPHHVTPDRRARLDEAPRPAWHPFPLTELCIFGGLVLIIVGFAISEHRVLLLAVGFSLVSLAAAELSLREHLAGYRSHSALLGAVAAILVVVALRLGLLPLLGAKVPQEVLTIIGVVVFGVVLAALRRVFQRRAGGLGFRA